MTTKFLPLFLFFGCLCICVLPPFCLAQTLRFATIDYCPFTCDPLTEDGKEGFMTDVLREAFEPKGYTLEIEMMPYVRAVSSVQSGTHDGIVVVGKDYAPDLVYPTQPTVSQRVAFIVKTGSPWKYADVSSLSQVTVGIVKGYHYVDPDLITYLATEQNNDARVHVIHGDSTTQRGLGMLMSNHISAFLEGEYSLRYELIKMEMSDAVAIAGYTTGAFEDYTGFNPKNQSAALYAQILSETLTKLKDTGRLNDILQRYGIDERALF